MNFEIDCVARAFYAAEHDELAWDRETEAVREEFRQYARAALALLAQQHNQERSEPETCVFPYAA